MNIDTSSLTDNPIGWFFNWGMSTDYLPVPNIWIVAGLLLIFLLIISIVRVRNVKRRNKELARRRDAGNEPYGQLYVYGDED